MLQLPVRARLLIGTGLAVLLSLASASARAMTDPFEPLNRAAFAFNNAFVDHVVEPLGMLGQTYLPPGIRQAARNVYSNLSEPEFILTNLFQGQFADAGIATGRIVVNTIVGIGGLYDPATRWGLVSRQPEFTEAVCSLGIPAGAYLQVPLVGPANVNSAFVLGGFMATEIYVLSLVSTWLAAADVVIDTAVAAALLRYSTETVGPDGDAYATQRQAYFEYIETSCTLRPAARVADRAP